MNVRLRKLQKKDVVGMYEWMSDKTISSLLQIDSNKISTKSCMKFISKSHRDKKNIHMAIVDEQDNYLGTISLKNINLQNKNAEFAIAIRSYAMKTGTAQKAFQEITRIGFEVMGLNKIYWCVRSDNLRAIKFYEKLNFRREGVFIQHILNNAKYSDLVWYAILKDEYTERIMNCSR